MIISISTSTFYTVDFEKALDLVVKAGFEYIELATYSKAVHWETAQHLRKLTAQQVANCVASFGLNVATMHETGGLISQDVPYLNQMFFDLCDLIDTERVVLHMPYIDERDRIDLYLERFQQDLSKVSTEAIMFENPIALTGYYIPYLDIDDLCGFCKRNGYFVNLDTSHCAKHKQDIIGMLDKYGDCVRSVHLSDYKGDSNRVFVGEGDLPLRQFLQRLHKTSCQVVTIECNVDCTKGDEEIVGALTKAREWVESSLNKPIESEDRVSTSN